MNNMISIQQFCSGHNLEITFIDELNEFGLIELTTIEQQCYIDEEQLPELEKLIRLNSDLGINPEGLAAIQHLLQKISQMQSEMVALRSQLGLSTSGA